MSYRNPASRTGGRPFSTTNKKKREKAVTKNKAEFEYLFIFLSNKLFILNK